MLEARSFRVMGRVQGVGFRWFVRDVAIREGLTGVVRNLPDGRVEAIAEGDREALDRFQMALSRGPAGSRVDAVDRDVSPATGRYNDFSIRG